MKNLSDVTHSNSMDGTLQIKNNIQRYTGVARNSNVSQCGLDKKNIKQCNQHCSFDKFMIGHPQQLPAIQGCHSHSNAILHNSYEHNHNEPI